MIMGIYYWKYQTSNSNLISDFWHYCNEAKLGSFVREETYTILTQPNLAYSTLMHLMYVVNTHQSRIRPLVLSVIRFLCFVNIAFPAFVEFFFFLWLQERFQELEIFKPWANHPREGHFFKIISLRALTPNKFRTTGSQRKKGLFFPAVRFEPGTAGWGARTLHLCYAVPQEEDTIALTILIWVSSPGSHRGSDGLPS